jgi:hypothetical protein
MAIPRPAAWTPVDDADFAVVADLLGRHPQGHFEIVLRHDDGTPRVIRNAPILGSGRPMPTLYWLVSPHDRLVVSRLESTGAVDVAEAEVDADELVAAHQAYRAEREALIPDGYDGHRPSAGVGGTRVGVKCLHAHYAYFLAGGHDLVGQWVADALSAGLDDS